MIPCSFSLKALLINTSFIEDTKKRLFQKIQIVKSAVKTKQAVSRLTLWRKWAVSYVTTHHFANQWRFKQHVITGSNPINISNITYEFSLNSNILRFDGRIVYRGQYSLLQLHHVTILKATTLSSLSAYVKPIQYKCCFRMECFRSPCFVTHKLLQHKTYPTTKRTCNSSTCFVELSPRTIVETGGVCMYNVLACQGFLVLMRQC